GAVREARATRGRRLLRALPRLARTRARRLRARRVGHHQRAEPARAHRARSRARRRPRHQGARPRGHRGDGARMSSVHDDGDLEAQLRADRALVDDLEDVWHSIAELGATLSESEWKTPSELPGWTVQDNVVHLSAVEAMSMGRPWRGLD